MGRAGGSAAGVGVERVGKIEAAAGVGVDHVGKIGENVWGLAGLVVELVGDTVRGVEGTIARAGAGQA